MNSVIAKVLFTDKKYDIKGSVEEMRNKREIDVSNRKISTLGLAKKCPLENLSINRKTKDY